jgi:NAD(P)-dependent dehydrogenase (short-subunit alcohol dehydrogenase family)
MAAQSLKDRSILVTGGGRGIGREIALLAGSLGARVVVNDPGVALDGSGSDQAPAEEVVQAIRDAGGIATANFDSVADYEGGERMVRQALDEFGRIDGVVHVAGILRDRMIFNMSREEWDAVLAVHLTGFFNVVKPASVAMRQQRFGRIVGFTSGAGLTGNSGQANYSAAKAGIVGGVRCAARDLGRYGVTANAIAPIAFTRMTQSVPDSARQLRATAGMPQAVRQDHIFEEFRKPQYIAPMVCYLLTDQAWDVNGKVFHVSGGSVALASEEAPFRSIAKAGHWTPQELAALVPTQLMGGVKNPAPPAPVR